eukprot:2768247-Amphidinium_carterae.1
MPWLLIISPIVAWTLAQNGCLRLGEVGAGSKVSNRGSSHAQSGEVFTWAQLCTSCEVFVCCAAGPHGTWVPRTHQCRTFPNLASMTVPSTNGLRITNVYDEHKTTHCASRLFQRTRKIHNLQNDIFTANFGTINQRRIQPKRTEH